MKAPPRMWFSSPAAPIGDGIKNTKSALGKRRARASHPPGRPHEIIITERGRQQNTARKLNSVTSSASLLPGGRHFVAIFHPHKNSRAARINPTVVKTFFQSSRTSACVCIGLRAVFPRSQADAKPERETRRWWRREYFALRAGLIIRMRCLL